MPAQEVRTTGKPDVEMHQGRVFSGFVHVNSFYYLLKSDEGTFACNRDGEVYPQEIQRKLS